MQLHNAENYDVKLLFAMHEALDLLTMSGFRKPVCHHSIPDCFNLSAALLDYHLMAKVKAEMDHFCRDQNTGFSQCNESYSHYLGTVLYPDRDQSLTRYLH